MRLSQRHARRGRPLRFESVESRLLLAASWTGLDQARAEYGLTGRGQTVAVIDTGIDYNHAALGGGFGAGQRVVGGFDFAEQDADPQDDGPLGGHGTHVAGVVGSSDPAHQGVAPGVDLVALRVFGDDGGGTLGNVADALEWIHANRNAFRWPITTVCISLEGQWNSSTLPSWAMLEGDLAQLQADGIFVAAAAGNAFAKYRQPGLSYPAVSPLVVPVASADANGALSSFSQRDAQVLVAPGRSIVSTVPDYVGNGNGIDNDFASFSGTSMAAPFVAGASVLLREAYQLVGVANPSPQMLYQVLFSTADTIHDPATGRDYHRLNVDRALDSIMPRDDYGSAEAAAYNLGSIVDARSLSGMIERPGDRDWFRFTAAQTGTVTLTIRAEGDLRPEWKLSSSTGGANPAAGNTLTFSVVAGRSYAFGLDSHDGLGRYSIDAKLAVVAAIPAPILTPIPAPTPTPAPTPAPASSRTDWGTVRQQEFDNYVLDTGGQWFNVTAASDGILTIEALPAPAERDIQIQLFDAVGNPIAAGHATADGTRLDVAAAAGGKFRLHAVHTGPGASAPVAFRVTNLVARSGRAVTVSGTDGNDRFAVVAGPDVQFAINGVAYEFDGGTIDRVTLSGRGAVKTARLAAVDYLVQLTGPWARA